jgi:hypothetical protein
MEDFREWISRRHEGLAHEEKANIIKAEGNRE